MLLVPGDCPALEPDGGGGPAEASRREGVVIVPALFVWRLSTPIWHHLRHPILVSIAISLLVPLTEVPNVIGMPKALGMLPFYVIGMYMTMDRFERLTALRIRIVSAAFLVAVGIACALFTLGGTSRGRNGATATTKQHWTRPRSTESRSAPC